MATRQSTSKSRSSRNSTAGPSLPNAVIDVVETQRKAIEVALALLAGVDASLQVLENSAGDVLDEDDPADALLLAARDIAHPIELVRLAMQRVYQAHEGLDSIHLERAAVVLAFESQPLRTRTMWITSG